MLIDLPISQTNFKDQEFLLFLLENCLVAPFDLYWVKKSGEKTKIISKASTLSFDETKKWTMRGLNFQFGEISGLENLRGGINLLLEFDRLSGQKLCSLRDLSTWRDSFVKWLKSSVESDKIEMKPFELSCLMSLFFFDLDQEASDTFFQFPEAVQSKKLAGAALGVCLAIITGYQNRGFLKDLYTSLLFMDYPFSQKVWTERDKKDLEVFISGDEQNVVRLRLAGIYEEHLEQGVEFVKKRLQVKSLANYLNWSFGKYAQANFLEEVSLSDMSDLDSIVISVHRALRYEVIRCEQTLNLKAFSEIYEKDGEHFYQRLKSILSTTFKTEEESREYLEIVGL